MFPRLRGLSTESRSRPPIVQTQVNGASSCNGDSCDKKCHLVKYWCRNVVFGLIRKRITCLVGIKYFRGTRCTFKGGYVMVKESRIECPNRQVSRPGQTVESRASSDWLAFRVPLVALVACRRQVSSIYRTSKQQIEVRIQSQRVLLGQRKQSKLKARRR